MPDEKQDLAAKGLRAMIDKWLLTEPVKNELYEILGDERGRDIFSIYAMVGMDNKPKYVMGYTDRWHGNPSLSINQRKRLSAKGNINAGKFMEYEDIPSYFVKKRARAEGGIMGKVMDYLKGDDDDLLEEEE